MILFYIFKETLRSQEFIRFACSRTVSDVRYMQECIKIKLEPESADQPGPHRRSSLGSRLAPGSS